MRRSLALVCITLLGALCAAPAQAQTFELGKGEHICIVGNTLAERMQHGGWLEPLIHARYPSHELVFRNLGYSGDEINGWQDGSKRLRSMSFGSQDEWLSASAPVPQPNKLSKRDQGKVRENRFELTNTKADVIFAFFGYNESWNGEAGLAKFKADAEAFLKHAASQKYNGKSASRVVLFSPIAHELIADANLPTAAEVAASNARLKMYSGALAEAAKSNGAVYVDLFTPTLAAFQAAGPGGSKEPHTINGVHLNAKGDRVVAEVAYQALFGTAPPTATPLTATARS